MGLNPFFPYTVCINLDRRSDRWAHMEAQFARHHIGPVIRLSALDGETVPIPSDWKDHPGSYGCLQSNLAVVRQARENRWPSVLILEDDVVFDEHLNARSSHCVSQLPSDWDMIFLGAMHRKAPIQISENVVKLTGSTSTYAYALRERVYDAFLDLNSRLPRPIDLNNLILQQQFHCYSFLPHLAWVYGDYSDTHGRAVNPWWLKYSLILGGSEMECIQKNTAVILPHRDRTQGQVGTRNLYHTTHHYTRLLPGITTVVVEQDEHSRVDPHNLPPSCQHVLAKDSGPFNKGRCFNIGFKRVESEKEFFIFADCDLWAGWDLKAILKQCLEYDFISSFAQTFDLTEEDTRRLINQERVDTSGYRPRRRTDLCREFCAFTRKGIQRVGGWDESDWPRAMAVQSQKVKQWLSVFECPGWALRLFSGPAES